MSNEAEDLRNLVLKYFPNRNLGNGFGDVYFIFRTCMETYFVTVCKVNASNQMHPGKHICRVDTRDWDTVYAISPEQLEGWLKWAKAHLWNKRRLHKKQFDAYESGDEQTGDGIALSMFLDSPF